MLDRDEHATDDHDRLSSCGRPMPAVDVAVRADDRLITIVDRLRDLIITGGFNVYSREVETVLATHPAVASCAMYGVPDDRWGEIVVAAVVLREGYDASPEELMEQVRLVKGAVWAPKRVHLRSSLPLTSIGKFDKRALRERRATGHDLT